MNVLLLGVSSYPLDVDVVTLTQGEDKIRSRAEKGSLLIDTSEVDQCLVALLHLIRLQGDMQR